jgi:hypothetical protein
MSQEEALWMSFKTIDGEMSAVKVSVGGKLFTLAFSLNTTN